MEITNIHPDIEKFTTNLDSHTKGQILRIADLLRIEEYHLLMPYSKKIEKNLYELRIKTTKNIRIFYTFHQNNIIFLHIINKEKQRLSKNDIETARNRLKWLR
ncbi:MAG: type II toxin-antitoxin system RelE/ParE family toxin [Candidatus Zambryskibacteria bacterium]|nr:type II toxin-antitoxin system RelE/ParE family toxin [Candidatus Zambryskibacteria bacterium]